MFQQLLNAIKDLLLAFNPAAASSLQEDPKILNNLQWPLLHVDCQFVVLVSIAVASEVAVIQSALLEPASSFFPWYALVVTGVLIHQLSPRDGRRAEDARLLERMPASL